MKHLKLFENFNNDEAHYIVNKVGNSYRIFAKTPKMKSNGSDYEDAKTLFGNGIMWKEYPTHNSAQEAIDSLVDNSIDESEPDEEEPEDY